MTHWGTYALSLFEFFKKHLLKQHYKMTIIKTPFSINNSHITMFDK